MEGKSEIQDVMVQAVTLAACSVAGHLEKDLGTLSMSIEDHLRKKGIRDGEMVPVFRPLVYGVVAFLQELMEEIDAQVIRDMSAMVTAFRPDVAKSIAQLPGEDQNEALLRHVNVWDAVTPRVIEMCRRAGQLRAEKAVQSDIHDNSGVQ